MTRTAVSGAVPAPVRPRAQTTAETYWQRVRTLARVRWRPFVVFCVLEVLFNLLRTTAVLTLDDPLRVSRYAGLLTLQYQSILGPFVFAALVLSEALGWRGIRHAAISLASIVLALALGLKILIELNGGVLNRPFVEANLIVSDSAFVGRSFWFNLAGSMLLVAYFAFREQEAASLRLAQEAATERTRTERATVAAKLKVLQAQVEPALLFGVLDEVSTLYGRAPVEADALLDDLIAYLRAALPQMRGDASTLGQEAKLAVSYVKVLPKGRRGEIVAEFTLDAAAEDLPFPLMVLLPLVQAAAEAQVTRITISLDTETLKGARVTVEPAQTPATWDSERLAPLCLTLQHYFGPDAGIDIAGSTVTVRWA